ncbi:MAG: glycoside hydrolase family 3 C-terminal domain-containing protein [Treponema sp.]|nr:glycoside hydrolase family 3 C-terminal domain-containing protein [Treponema sp.]
MEKYRDPSLSAEERAADLISRMTLREKTGQLNQRLSGFNCYEKTSGGFLPNNYFKDEVNKFGSLGVMYGLFRADAWSHRDFENGILPREAAKTANAFQRYVKENTRLGIPVLLSAECPHGHQALDGYLFPTNTGSASSFNPELLRRCFSVCAKQMRRMGIHLALVSTMDMLRDGRWGRSEECYGEDPFLAAAFAKAAIIGLQGEDRNDLTGPDKVAAVAKHLCGQGETTGGLNTTPALIGERELREIHLPAVRASIEAGAWGVMAAYNEIDGILCHANKKLLTDILRREYGFDGIVMADAFALDALVELTGSPVKAAALALNCGVDLSLWDDNYTYLEEAVESGLLDTAVIDTAVARVLTLKFRMGLFENPYTDEGQSEYFTPDYITNQQSFELAKESVILLENKNSILPLANKPCTIAVIGPNADNLGNQIGLYTAPQRENTGYTIYQGISDFCPRGIKVKYSEGCRVRSKNTGSVKNTDSIEEAAAAAQESDIVILVLGGNSNRTFDMEFDKNGAAVPKRNDTDSDCGEGVDAADLGLPGLQNELAGRIFETGKPVISVIIGGRPYCVRSIAEKSAALLYAFYPGPMGGKAIAKILFGSANPCGRLTVSLPSFPSQFPCYYNKKAIYSDRNYVDRTNEPLYPFGYGLSYAEISFGVITADRTSISVMELETGKTVHVSIPVINNSGIAAMAVPQLYLEAKHCGVSRRIRELKGFQKIALEPYETAAADFYLGLAEFKFFDENMEYVIKPHQAVIYCGSDSSAGQCVTLEIKE